MLQIDVGRHKAVLHHQHGIDRLAGACHPTLVPRHRLGAANPRPLPRKQAAERHRLLGIALRRGSGVSIDIVDPVRPDAGVGQCALHGDKGALLARLRDTAAVARKAVAADLGENAGTACLGVVVVLQHQSGCPSARHQAVTVAVERTGRLRGRIGAGGEGA